MNPERPWSARNASGARTRTLPAASLARAVILPRRPLVLDELREGAWIVGVPYRVHHVPARRKERARLSEKRVVTLVDPAHAVSQRARALAASDRFAVREPRQVDAARDGQADPFPDARIDVEQEMLLPLRVPDELDLADAVIAIRAKDRRPPVDDLGDLFADDQTSRAESLGVLLELAADERAAHLAVRRDVRAERVEASRRNVDDLLRHARQIGGLGGKSHQLFDVLGAKDLHAEAIVEAPLLGWLDDRGVADLLRGRSWILQGVRPRYRDPEMMRIGVEASLVEHRIDDRKLAERNAVTGLQLRAVPRHRKDPFVVRREEHRALAEMPRVVEEIRHERLFILERVRAAMPLDHRLGRLTEAARVRIECDDLDPVRGQRARNSEAGDVTVEDERAWRARRDQARDRCPRRGRRCLRCPLTCAGSHR